MPKPIDNLSLQPNHYSFTQPQKVGCAFAIAAALLAIGLGRMALMSLNGVNLGHFNILSLMGSRAAHSLEIGGSALGSLVTIYLMRKVYLSWVNEKRVADGKINTRPGDESKLRGASPKKVEVVTKPEQFAEGIFAVLDGLNLNQDQLNTITVKLGLMMKLLEKNESYTGKAEMKAKPLDRFTFWQVLLSETALIGHAFVLRLDDKEWSLKHFTIPVGDDNKESALMPGDEEFQNYIGSLDGQGANLLIDPTINLDH